MARKAEGMSGGHCMSSSDLCTYTRTHHTHTYTRGGGIDHQSWRLHLEDSIPRLEQPLSRPQMGSASTKPLSSLSHSSCVPDAPFPHPHGAKGHQGLCKPQILSTRYKSRSPTNHQL